MVFLNSFGRRSPLGDIGRVAQWLKTGDGGQVARAARNYEHRKTWQFTQIDKLPSNFVTSASTGNTSEEKAKPPSPLRHLIRLSAPLRNVYLPL